jgi:hypothetical protein
VDAQNVLRSEKTVLTNTGSSPNMGENLDPWMHRGRVATVVSIITRIIIIISITIIAIIIGMSS